MGKKKSNQSETGSEPGSELFEAVSGGNISRAAQAIANGADVCVLDEHGFTPMHRAVSNEEISANRVCSLVELLVEYGADVNAKLRDGRSVIFLAAEFQTRKAVIELLLSLGADPNVRCGYGVHIVENARSKVVQKLLESVTGEKRGQLEVNQREEKPLTLSQWRTARRKISRVFAKLESENLLCLHNAGTTQSDGMSDCMEEIHERGGLEKSGIIGFCFYTSQDLKRCKACGYLSLGFWGAPAGKKCATMKVGKLIVSAFEDESFEVDWNRSADERPAVWL